MIRQINFVSVILLGFGILFIRETSCYPAETSDDFLSLGLNYFTKTAKSVSPNYGFNRLLSPFSDLQTRIRNSMHNTERNNIDWIQKSLHPWQINRYNAEKSKENFEKQYRSNEEPSNLQWNIFTNKNIGKLSSVTPNNVIVSDDRATEQYVKYATNKAVCNNDDNTYETETSTSTEATTEFTTDSTEYTTEIDELSNRLAVPPQVVASLLG
ncbi:uncharacterized protein LOC123866690 [Maniola jurtina]|uniref:uncharacterized protein LOC123866690 n=1 Tax=Maniola jurtina TaxID=191418 RepID=UPI001E68D767|nr:uncharacterized protein LOC123866690 [Maniola jurtina]